ncbi:Hypothetical predicted protein [Mytilus galloprovincialis]|uniref:C-type lectin domain-containing protein n=1 Tax=Mytilus galloprovincialis TaxID=29158 RepID=A0A8B6CG10_MYTGA|nr:Hypothetical predicted protein [Mytilus galloprovincialis]
MKILTLILGIIINTLGIQGASICNDHNTLACQRLAAIKPDLCQDNCTARLCPSTCDQCPLTCYSCDSVDHPANCTHTVKCSNLSMMCIATQTVTPLYEKVYQLGCVDKEICSSLFGLISDHPSMPNVRRTVDLLGGCCSSDLCNKYKEPDNVSMPTVQTVQPTSKDKGVSQGCHEIDTEACRFLSQNKGCDKQCVSSLCPQTCGQCSFTCYDCSLVNQPHNCSSKVQCNKHTEVCVAAETHVSGFQSGYKLGCIEKQTCSNLLSRDIDGTCCNTSFCNAFYLPKQTITQVKNLGLPSDCQPNILKAGDCPIGFAKSADTCYFVGRWKKTRTAAKHECESMCSRLAILSSEKENHDVSSFLANVQHTFGYKEEPFYWIDAYRFRRRFNKPWRWNSTGLIINSHAYTHWNPNSHPNIASDGEHCANIGQRNVYGHLHGNGNYYWDHRSCAEHYPALCEYPLGSQP